jgi:hypothetical protein
MKLKLKSFKRAAGILLSLFFLAGIAMIGMSCSSSEYIPGKMDTALQQKIRETEKENEDEIIKFAGKTSKEINDEMKTKLESTGIKTESIIKDIFTASGNAESIKKVTLLDFVINLEIAKKLELK